MDIPDEMTMPEYLDFIKAHNRTDMDSVILVTGYEGLGKSTVAGWVAHELDPKFTIPQIIFYDVQKFWTQVNDPEWYRVILCDEAMKFLLAYDWSKAEAKAIITELAFCRFRRKFFIFCIPTPRTISFYVRDHRAKFWIYVKERGLVEMHIAIPQKWRDSLYWKQVGSAGVRDYPPDIKEMYQDAKAAEKKLDQCQDVRLTANHVLTLLKRGLLDGVVGSNDEKVRIKAFTYLALEKLYPYSTIAKGNIGVAVDIWAS